METKAILNLKKHFIKERVTKVDSHDLAQELYFIECNPEVSTYLVNVKNKITEPLPNVNNSTVMWVMGITDEAPKGGGISRTPTTLPDIDYDTDGRNQIKEYLTKKYGQSHVTLLGTYQTLKTKGAVKDVIRQLLPAMPFEEVNALTKKFDGVKRTDSEAIREIIEGSGKDYSFLGEQYSSELAFFYACLEFDPALKKWFQENPAIQDSVSNILGNAKASGIHAGGIVVSSANVPETIPLTFSEDDNLFVTQPEMAYVEESGLVKYDFLGLKTLGDLNLAMKLIKQRKGKEFTFKDIPLDDKAVLDEFRKGNTISVFQFNTDLSVSILTKLKSVDNINDLAIITSIARPGPLAMKMDISFIKRKNGEEPITYLHPLLEPILKDTYGIIVYQEQVMKVVQALGGLTGDESVTVLKGMGKKQLDKILKYKEKFLKYATTQKSIKQEKAEEIWAYLQAFAEYGFNRSHAIAYSCVSYLCMWFKQYYSAEWISAVLSGADKEDFKIFYQSWKNLILPPNVNLSGDLFKINSEEKVIMPFSAINGVGGKVVEAIVEMQPYKDFDDFFARVDKRRVTKASMISLVLAGCFDSFKPDVHYSENKWRKQLLVRLVELREKVKKPSAKEKEENAKFVDEVKNMTRGQMVMKEISLLNFTSFDYYEQFYAQMTEGAKKIFGAEALKPEQVLDQPNNKAVVVGGAVESIIFFPIKTGKNKGKEMAKIVLTNEGNKCEIVVFPKTIESSDKGTGKIRKIKEFTPLIVKGKVNHWNGNVSVIFDECWILI
jgi:DNA-directed DNA polymerase III PolC